MRKPILVFMSMIFSWSCACAQEDVATISLPRPDTTGGKPLMQVLKARHSSRTFDNRKLPDQVLANLLWAGFGVNRPDGRRTAPSARNWQEMEIYVATADGLFLYDAPAHGLKVILREDVRAKTGSQSFVAAAPVTLVFVADLTKSGIKGSDEQNFYSGADCGFIAENVYLYCASEGLSVVVRAMVDRGELAKVMNLRSTQKIVLAQTVGYPKAED